MAIPPEDGKKRPRGNQSSENSAGSRHQRENNKKSAQKVYWSRQEEKRRRLKLLDPDLDDFSDRQFGQFGLIITRRINKAQIMYHSSTQ